MFASKIRDCLSARLEEPRLGRTLDLLDNLEYLSAQETAQLMALVA